MDNLCAMRRPCTLAASAADCIDSFTHSSSLSSFNARTLNRCILRRLSAASISSVSTISLRARVSPSRSHDRPPSLLHSVFSLEDTFAFHRLWQNVRRNLRGNKERQPVRCIFAAMPRRTCAFAPALSRFAAINPQQLHLCRTSASGTTATCTSARITAACSCSSDSKRRFEPPLLCLLRL